VIAGTKDAYWAYWALRKIPNLTEPQRTTLCDVIVASRHAGWANCALRNISDLTDAQRSALQKIAQAA
jgi:hypothetical protein